MKLWQEGYPNSVALSGTNLTGAHVMLLAELRPKSVAVMMDGDEAGRRAAMKIGQKLMDTFGVFIVDTPDGCDPKVLDKKDFKALFRHADKIEKRLA
jgi:DNA primase